MSPQEVSRQHRPSMGDVAAAAGVSKAAVSKVIRNAYGVSPAMRARVESAITDLGYRPHLAARAMRGASFTFGFEIPQLGNDFFTQMMQGAVSELAGSGYQLIIAPGYAGMRGGPVLNALVDRQVDGLIAVSPEVSQEWLETLGENVPIVLLGRHDESRNYDTLTNDDHLGAMLVMNHLFDLGHERIAHLTVSGAPEAPLHLLPHTIRRAAYETAMVRRGLAPQVLVCGPLEPNSFGVSMDMLSASDRPTAIFAGNDTLAIGALHARTQLGLTAADLSIAGYDNIALASNPLLSMTTVDQFGLEAGAKAVQLLMERIQERRSEACHHVIKPELRVRDSTQPAPLIDWTRTEGVGAREGTSDSRQPTKRPRRSAEAAELERLRGRNTTLEAQLSTTRAALDIVGQAHALLEQLCKNADDLVLPAADQPIQVMNP